MGPIKKVTFSVQAAHMREEARDHSGIVSTADGVETDLLQSHVKVLTQQLALQSGILG